MSPPPALRFDEVRRKYGPRTVLDGVSMDVGCGESLALVGVNGAGKTTLIKGMLDLSAIDAGRIEIFGTSHRERRARRRLAFLPERFSPPYYLNGRDFLAYTLRLQGQAYDPDAARAMLARLDLDPAALAQPVRAYSKGMAQKLGLAACFLSGRDLLVLDEPMSGLDPKARALVKAVIGELRAQGRTLFFSSHSLADVEELADRLAILHGGRLAFLGKRDECLECFSAADLESAFLACIGASASPQS